MFLVVRVIWLQKSDGNDDWLHNDVKKNAEKNLKKFSVILMKIFKYFLTS